MSQSELAADVLSYLDDETVRPYPGDEEREFAENTWSYATKATVGERDDVMSALRTVADRLQDRFAGRFAGPVTFYAWYDVQELHLLCSMHSCTRDNLPFGGRYYVTDSPDVVVDQVVLDAERFEIPWDEFTEWDGTEEEEPEPLPFPVWAVQLA